jgi:hypothetical protein
MKTRLNFARLGLMIVIAILVLGIAAVSLPSVRAAISAYLGLGVASSDVIHSPVLTITSSGKGVLPTVITTNQAGLVALSPTWLPEGYSFDHMDTVPDQKMVVLTFFAKHQLPGSDSNLTETRTLTLAESLQNSNIPLMVAPSTSVEDITVNGSPAAYAVGAWDSQFVPDAKDPKGGSFQAGWRSDLPIQNLFWQSGPVYLALISDDPAVSKEDLVRMASSVK